MEGDDRTGRGGVGVFVEDDDVLVRRRVAAQHLAADELVHVDIGLVQPHPLEGRGVDAEVPGVVDDHVRDHRHHVLEDLSALLDEQFVGRADTLGGGVVQEAEIVADVVLSMPYLRSVSFQLRVQDFQPGPTTRCAAYWWFQDRFAIAPFRVEQRQARQSCLRRIGSVARF